MSTNANFIKSCISKDNKKLVKYHPDVLTFSGRYCTIDVFDVENCWVTTKIKERYAFGMASAFATQSVAVFTALLVLLVCVCVARCPTAWLYGVVLQFILFIHMIDLFYPPTWVELMFNWSSNIRQWLFNLSRDCDQLSACVLSASLLATWILRSNKMYYHSNATAAAAVCSVRRWSSVRLWRL